MKKFVGLLFIAFIMASCGQEDKKTQLDNLKQERSALDEQIKTLEKEIALEGDSTLDDTKTRDVEVKAVAFETFRHFIDVQGMIDGEENLNASAQTSGIVDRILVKEGDEVSTGQVLAVLDNSILIQSMHELQTSLDYATEIYDKQKRLWDQKIGTEVQYLSAKNNKESLENKMATLKEQLELSKIKSPINGVVDAVDVKIGQAVMPGISAFRVVNLGKLKAKAEISETYASKVKKGNNVIVFLPDLGVEVPSKINYTSKVINKTTRTFSAEAELSSAGYELRPNMIAVLKVVDYQNDSAIVVPLNYVQSSGMNKYLYVATMRDGKKVATKRDVTIGQVYNGKAEVTSGLKVDDELITSGQSDLIEGTPIKY